MRFLNEKADFIARRAVGLHGLFSSSDAAFLEDRKAMRVLWHGAGRLLAKWPSPRELGLDNFPRVAAVVAVQVSTRGPARHPRDKIVWTATRWKCLVCWRCSTDRVALHCRACRGSSPHIASVLQHLQGHRIWATVSKAETWIVFCAVCGAYSQALKVGLLGKP